MRVDIRLVVLVGMLALAGCMPVKKAPAPGEAAQAPAQAEGSLNASALSDDADEDLNLGDEGVFSPEQEEARAADPLSSEEQKILDTDISFHIGLDTVENEDVQRYFHYYTHTHRKTMAGWLKRAQRYLPHIRARFLEEGLPEDLIYLPFAESGFNPFALSRSGAAGVWQFMPRTGIHYGLTVDDWIDERCDPYASTEAAIKYLKKIYNDFGDWSLALAAYNAGEGTIGRALAKTGCEDYFSLCEASDDLHQETKLYVPKFLALVKIVRNLEALGFEPLDWTVSLPVLAKLKAKPGTDLSELAKVLGMDWKTFQELNPVLRKKAAPPKRFIHVAVPSRLTAKAEEYLKKPVLVRSSTRYASYKVRPGDTWWGVAKKHKVSVEALQAANKKGAAGKLQIGQALKIPGVAALAKAEKADAGEWAAKRANYVVREGDTLWGIAKQFKMDAATLSKANNLSSKALKVGQKIYVPDMGGARTMAAKAKAAAVRQKLAHYKVRQGDSLWSIARRFGVSPADLRQWNKLAETSVIRPGDELKVLQ